MASSSALRPRALAVLLYDCQLFLPHTHYPCPLYYYIFLSDRNVNVSARNAYEFIKVAAVFINDGKTHLFPRMKLLALDSNLNEAFISTHGQSTSTTSSPFNFALFENNSTFILIATTNKSLPAPSSGSLRSHRTLVYMLAIPWSLQYRGPWKEENSVILP